MSSPNPPGDPRTGRDRRVPARVRTFKHGTIDPVTTHRRPLLTVGNLILLVIIIGFGMYATGNLPQLDAFFDHVNNYGRAHNNLVVNIIITYGALLFGALVVALVVWMISLFVNANRRSHSDPKGWHKIANAPPEHRKSERRHVNLPSMIMPIGKERRVTSATIPEPQLAVSPTPPNTPPTILTSDLGSADTTKPDPGKAEAIAAAAKAEAALADAPTGLPSFVRPRGKTPKQNAEVPAPAIPPVVLIAEATAAPATDTSLIAPNATTAKVEAAIAAAKATAAKAEAAIAAAKVEAAIAAAKAEIAVAEAAVAAAKAQSLSN